MFLFDQKRKQPKMTSLSDDPNLPLVDPCGLMCDIKEVGDITNRETKTKVVEHISELIGSDCWAVSVCGETVYNSFTDPEIHTRKGDSRATKSWSDFLKENQIRKYLIEDGAHMVVTEFYRRGSGHIDIYTQSDAYRFELNPHLGSWSYTRYPFYSSKKRERSEPSELTTETTVRPRR